VKCQIVTQLKFLLNVLPCKIAKANDYQNKNSRILQADYYTNGCATIHDIMHGKMLRMQSVMEAMQNDPSYNPNFESLEDSAKDLINYASFFVAYLRGKVEGQREDRDFLNRKIFVSETTQSNVNQYGIMTASITAGE